MKHYINEKTGQVYGYKPDGVEVREMTNAEFQTYKHEQENPEPTTEELAASVRAERNALMAACDWVVVKATETGEPVPEVYAEYRQALRDITTQEGFPEAVIWPEAPA